MTYTSDDLVNVCIWGMTIILFFMGFGAGRIR